MNIKPDPKKERHRRRKAEIKAIFKRVPYSLFKRGLEVGAGDGYQSTLLTNYVQNLVCTEYVQGRLPTHDTKKIKYKVADAEKIDSYFENEKFDIVFSSNLMEHLNEPHLFLSGVDKLLKHGGISIHSMPNRFWKFSHMMLHHFNYFILLLEILLGSKRYVKNIDHVHESYDNQKESRKYSQLRRVIWPIPHGVSKNNLEEFITFGKKQWCKVFKKNGFRVLKILKGPISSGYSFGFKGIRKFLRRRGFSSEYIYIIARKKEKCKYENYFRRQTG